MEINVFVVDDEERQRRFHRKAYGLGSLPHARDRRIGSMPRKRWKARWKTPPDLLITDIRLLGTDGLELSARMRRMNPRIRIIMVTGYEEFQYAKTALDIGVDAFLVKPIIFEELNAILERVYQEEQSNVIKSKEAMSMQEQIDVVQADCAGAIDAGAYTWPYRRRRGQFKRARMHWTCSRERESESS